MTKKGEEHESEILLASYRTLNDFLCAFINKSLPIYSYAVRQRLFFEKILNFELGLKTDRDSQGNVQSVFLIGRQRETRAMRTRLFALQRLRPELHPHTVRRLREFAVHLEHRHVSVRRLLRHELRPRRDHHLPAELRKEETIDRRASTSICFVSVRRETASLAGTEESLEEDSHSGELLDLIVELPGVCVCVYC